MKSVLERQLIAGAESAEFAGGGLGGFGFNFRRVSGGLARDLLSVTRPKTAGGAAEIRTYRLALSRCFNPAVLALCGGSRPARGLNYAQH
jgi:hypothetical protein